MADSRLRLARRDLSALSREKTIVLALLIQLFVAAFSSFLVVGLTSLYDPSSVSGGEVEVAATGNATDELVEAARRGEGVDVQVYDDPARAEAAFRDGLADAVVEASHEDRRIAVTVTAPSGSLRKTLIVVQVRGLLERLERIERNERAEHLDRRLVPVPTDVPASPYFGFAYTVLIPLLIFMPVFIAGSVAVDSVTEEVERGTLELLRVAPVSLTDVVEGKALAAIALAPAQVALWVALLALNGIGVANAPLLLVLVTALAVGLVAFGVGLAVLTPDRQQAQLLYSLGILAFFAATALLPEHPSTTVARLAIDSATTVTYLTVGGYAAGAIAVAVIVRALVARADPEAM